MNVEAAIRALRRGEPVVVEGMQVLAVETAADPAPDGFASADLLITAERAAVLNLINQRAAAASGAAVRIVRTPGLDLAAARHVADPVSDLATPFKGPFRTAPLDAPEAAAAALRLVKLAGLLPALLMRPAGAPGLSAAQVAAYDSPATLAVAARARLPLAAAPEGELVAFRGRDGGPEHLALILGRPILSAPVLVRLHSSCLTGDLLGSLRCDCGPQLAAAIEQLGGGGILLYLNQEGRGIGLVNKLRAYALQDQGFDTLEANERLGFRPDERDFGLAAAMLRELGVGAVRLLTNNPDKVAALEGAGVPVVERVPLWAGEGAENAAYLATKRARAGHL